MVFKVDAGIDHSSGSEDLNYSEDTDLVKDILSTTTGTNTTNTNNTTTNSGSTNTGHTSTTGGTSGSTNSTTNSGSTNLLTNSGSQNTILQGPSSSTTTNSGHTDTSQVMLTQEAVNHLTQQMLESTQGLASVSRGEHLSGAYNSSTNSMMVNDLLSRVAGEVAVRGAKTVNTVGGSTSTTENSGSLTTQTIGGYTNTQDIGGSTSTTDVGATKNFSESDVLNVIGGSTSDTKGTSVTDVLNNTVGKETSAGSTTGTKEKDTSQTEEKASASGGWIVCTELHKQGRLPHRFYRYGYRAFAKYDEQGKKGYYIWAVPAVKHLRKHPHSKLSNFLCTVMNARAEYLSAEAGCKDARKTVLGFMTKHLMYAGCWILSRTVAKNYSETSAVNTTGANHAGI